MKKYKRLFSNFIQMNLAYRENFFAELVMRSLGFFIMIFLWKAVYAQRTSIQGFSFNELLTYFLIVEVFRHLLEAKTFLEIKEGVQKGTIANYLLLPIDSIKIYFSRTLARSILSFVFFIVPVLFLIYGTKIFVLPPSIWYSLMTIGMGIIAMFMSLLLYTIFGSIAFWTVETGNIIWAFNFIVMFLAGKMIPLQFMPGLIKTLVGYSPLASLFNLPATLYLGKLSYTEALIQFGVQIGWLLILYLLLRCIWRKGLRRMELVGG